MLTAIKNRRSVREYLAEPIKEEQLKEIISAAMCAPSANAIYPWELVVVKDVETKEKLSKVTPWSNHANEASVVIAVIGNPTESPDWVEDCSIVADHIWLQVSDLGLGSCWIQIRGNDNAEKSVKSILHIPDDRRVLCLMPIGTPVIPVVGRDEIDYDKSKIKNEKY
ncbi:MAG: nitroreductase family protein [bacterium]